MSCRLLAAICCWICVGECSLVVVHYYDFLVACCSRVLKNGMELKGDLAYCWGGKSTGYEFEGMLVNLPPSCTSVFFRVCFPVKRRSFQKSLLRLERIIHSQERSQASQAKVFRQPSGNSRLPERHLMGFTLHNSHLHRLTPHTAPHLTPHTLLFP